MNTDENDLVRMALAGSADAFAELVSSYERRLARFLRMRTDRAEDVEELLQDTFMRAWNRLHQFDPARAFAPWLFTIAARLQISRRRRPQLPAATDRELDELTSSHDPAEVALRADEQRNLWDLVLDVLGPEPRTVLWLFYAEDLSTDRIGAIMGKNGSAVRAMLHRSRERLASHFSEPISCSRES